MVDPLGTITRTVCDSQGRVASVWAGTNDTPASRSWSPTNNMGTSKFGGRATGALAYNARAATVQAALQALSSLGPGT